MSCLPLCRIYKIQHADGFHLIQLRLHIDVDVRLKNRRVLDFLGVINLVHAPDVADLREGGAVASTNHDVCLVGRCWIVELLDVGFNLARETVGEIEGGTAPELALLEGTHVVPGYNGEVVPSTAERDEQIPILVCTGVDNLSGS